MKNILLFFVQSVIMILYEYYRLLDVSSAVEITQTNLIKYDEKRVSVMKITTKKLISFITAVVMTASTFTFVNASVPMTASYDSASDAVTIENIPSTGAVHQITIAMGEEALADVTADEIIAFEQDDWTITREIPIDAGFLTNSGDLPNGIYTVHVGGSSNYTTCTFTVASIEATHDPDTDIVTISNIPTDGVTVQTIRIENSANQTVAIEEYNTVAATQTIPVDADLPSGTYTVYVGCDGIIKTCTLTVVQGILATYDIATEKVTVSYIPTEATGCTIIVKNGTGTPVAIEEYDDAQATRIIDVLPLQNGTYTVEVGVISGGQQVILEAEFTVTGVATPAPTATPVPTATPASTASPTVRPLPTATPYAPTPTQRPTQRPQGGGGGGGGFIMAPTEAPSQGGSPSSRFTDMGSYEWAIPAVEALANLGIINGRTDTTYEPYASVTRAEYTKMICAAMGVAVQAGVAQKFNDVPKSHWAFGYIAAAESLGIVEGYTDTEFAPNDLITREQMATILYRAIVASENEGRLPVGSPLYFADAGQISEYAREAVNKLSAANVINGVTDTTFVPQATANRAQAASILYQYFKAIGTVR